MKSSTLLATAAVLLSRAAANQFVMYTGSTTSNGDDSSVQRADPILAPGVISNHVHQFTGSDALAPEVSYESLQKASCTTVGDASGNGNIADKSIYWHPALFAQSVDGSGFIRVPTLGHKFYYKDVGVGTKREPFEFPHGFRMLAGDPFMRGPADDEQRQNITQWICHDSNGRNQGTAGGFPTGVTDCDSYPGFNGAIHFPHCWNGEDFNPSSPTAHVVYPTGDIQNGECPSTHPTRLPHIFVENQFNIHDMIDKVKPDSFTLSMGDSTGYGWHFDFFNGWDDGAIPKLLENCPQDDFGNQDVGDCPDFQAGPKSDQCKQSVSFAEDVTNPGKNLPGCNPISDVNPAPKYQAAPLGTSSTACRLASGGGPPGDPSDAPSPSEPAPSGSSSSGSATSSAMPSNTVSAAQLSPSAGSTTLLTSTKPTAAPSASAEPTSSPSSNGGGSGDDSPEISCPDSHRQTYTVHGKTFRVQCGVDHRGGDMKAVTAHSLGECVQACAATDGCVDVSLSGVACYLKSELGPRYKNSGVNGAKLVPSRRPRRSKPYQVVKHRHAARHVHPSAR